MRKEHSAFFPAAMVERARANAQTWPWAKAAREQIVAAAQPWMDMSDDELWRLMFGNTLKRSWMVWSNGHCPACGKSVPMYTWVMDALRRPWKTQCPHCKEYFPKNDFEKYYRSGLDEHHVFDPKRADRSLLFNVEHPDPADPLHMFGVDDGDGYVDGEKRWRFINAYLIFGQWKQAIVAGIRNLAAAYTLTGDPAYAHKAGILLDRVADLYPTMDFGKEGVMYEGPPRSGYVSTWHDACEETREMALAYDQIVEALRRDGELVAFLRAKAAQYGLANPKASSDDVQRNIEDRILRDALANRDKIYSNYPRTEITVATIETVLAWPANRKHVGALLDGVLDRTTAVDGVTGEKGLSGYTCFTISGVATLLEQYARMDARFLPDLLKRHPRLRETYRFHIDTMCLDRYYPLIGDAGAFASPTNRYVGVNLSASPDLTASMYSFLWRLYEATGDPAFVQVLYHANDDRVDDLPYDIFAADPDAFQRGVRKVIDREGTRPKLSGINKRQWCLAILRSGTGDGARAAWLDYDSGGGHGHMDGMNLGLFARGLDLLPDFGYPPVHYGGWGAPRSVWYAMTAAHNTVVVDGKNQQLAAGKTTLWADGTALHAIRASAPDLIGGRQYERTIAVVDVSDREFYLFDVFRVVGGTDHAKFTHSHFGTIDTQGLALKPGDEFGQGTQMRAFRCDPRPRPGWSVDWRIEDRRKLLPPGTDVRMRYTDLTTDAQAYTCEAWISVSGFSGHEEAWIPRVMTRRTAAQAPLASTFVAVIEPYEQHSGIAAIHRLPVKTENGAAYPDSYVAVEIARAEGGRDVLVAADVENPLGNGPSRSDDRVMVVAPDLKSDAELCLVRTTADGGISHVAVCRGAMVKAGDIEIRLKKSADLVEIAFDKDGNASIVSGAASNVDAVLTNGRALLPAAR